MKKAIFILLFALLFTPLYLFAQQGVLDTTFGTKGIVRTDFTIDINNETTDAGSSIAIQNDGRIVVSGASDSKFVLARYNIDGTLDIVFGNIGKVIFLPGNGSGLLPKMLLQPDGKIIQASACYGDDGTLDFAIARYKTNGTLDSTFNGTGVKITPVGSGNDAGGYIALQDDNRILQAGHSNSFAPSYFDITVLRYKTDGTLDDSFGNGGKVVIIDTFNLGEFATAIKVLNDHKIIVFGYSNGAEGKTLIYRLNLNGTIDNSFGINGSVITTTTNNNCYVTDIIILEDSKMLTAGFPILMKYNPNGTLDTTFSHDGMVTDIQIEGKALALQPDGKILVACRVLKVSFGDSTLVGVMRFNANGMVDSSFGNNGIIITDASIGSEVSSEVYDMALQPDGKIVITGSTAINTTSHFMTARYLSGLNVGVLNLSLKQNPILIYPNPINTEAVLQYALTGDEKLTIALYDVQGRVVQHFITNENREKGEHKETLELDSNLAAGNYILTISNNTGRQSIKLIKQ